MKAETVFIAGLIASGITAITLLVIVRKEFTVHFSTPLYREMLRFGLPYIPAGLAGIAIQVIDRPILKALTDNDTVGIYQANYRLGVLMMLVVGMFDYAWRPFFLPLATGAGAVVNVIANLLLIPRLGMTGAAVATLLSYVVMAVGIYFPSQRFYHVRYEWSRLARVFVLGISIVLVFLAMDLQPMSGT